MTKKILAFAVSAALLAPAFASAADVEFSGNARYRFASVDNGGAKADKYDNRVRFGATVKNDGGVKIFVQGESDYQSQNGTNAPDTNAAAGNDFVQVDQAYIEVPMGAVTVTAGDQKATWGAGFKLYDEKRSNRIKAVGKIGDVTIGGLLDDDTTDGTTGNDLKNGTVFVTGKVADWTLGAITNQRTKWSDVFATGSIGSVGVAFEYSTQDAGALTPTGTLLQLTAPILGVTGILASVTTSDGFTADNDFAPISTLGTTQNTAMANVGALGDWNTVLLGATGKVSNVSWTVLLGTTDIDTGAGTVTTSVSDVKVAVNVAKGTDVNVSYGNLGDDLDYTATGLSITTKW